MATSTERTLRNVLVEAIQGIATTKLGFSKPLGNVQAYPIEMQPDEKLTAYLKADVITSTGAVNQARCWAVDVQGHDEPYAMNNVGKRLYTIRIVAYYDAQGSADNYLTLIDHARYVREAVKNLGINLSGTVTRIASAEPFAFDVIPSSFGNLYRGEMRITAERTNPDF